MPTIEALFNGCIPLARHNVGSDAIIKEQSSCFWRDTAELANKLSLALASDDNEYQKLRSDVIENYSPEVLAKRFIDFFGLQAPCFEKEH